MTSTDQSLLLAHSSDRTRRSVVVAIWQAGRWHPHPLGSWAPRYCSHTVDVAASWIPAATGSPQAVPKSFLPRRFCPHTWRSCTGIRNQVVIQMWPTSCVLELAD